METTQSTNQSLPCLPNLLAHEATWLEPWDFSERPHIKFPDKAAYKAYIGRASTKSCLFSGVSGMIPSERVSRKNPPTRLHAIVADYDTRIDEKKRSQFLAKLAVKPSFISRSYSGGTHAVWLMEEPLPLLPDNASHHALLKAIAKDLKLNRAFGTLDETAFYNLSQIYHVGWDWQIGGGSPLPLTRALLWMKDAIKKAKSEDLGIVIPIERVEEEMNKRFPNRWEGDFSIGSRGCRFWDEFADNHSAAIVTEHGMVCFTGAQSFRSWKSIFGDEFLKSYEQDTLGSALKDSYFIGNKFYIKEGDTYPSWMGLNRQNMESYLATTYGLRTKIDKDSGDDESEVKRAIGAIIQQKRLYGTVPLIYNPNEVVVLSGEKILNTNKICVHPPAEEAITTWADGFPWIASFLEGLFPDNVQRDRFVCEWAYAYRHAYQGKPKNGRTIFIAGEKKIGKNFITEVLIGPSLGGFVDASPYVMGDTKFNESFFRSGVWVLNDSVNKDNFKDKQKFSQTLKKMAANMSHTVEGKFKDPITIPWSGRLYITLNTDPSSLSLLPEIDINNTDKMSLYQAAGKEINDPNAAQKALKELPMLCSYLLHMEYPEHCVGDARWGVRGFLHPELYESAESSGKTATFEETLNMYLKSVFEADRSIDEISCPATEWFVRLAGDEQTGALMHNSSPIVVARQLSSLMTSGRYPINYSKRNRGRFWSINRTAWYGYLNSPAGDNLDETMPF